MCKGVNVVEESRAKSYWVGGSGVGEKRGRKRGKEEKKI